MPRGLRWWFIAFGIAAFCCDLKCRRIFCKLGRNLGCPIITIFVFESDIVQSSCTGLGSRHAAIFVMSNRHYWRQFIRSLRRRTSWTRRGILYLVLSCTSQEVVGCHGYENHALLNPGTRLALVLANEGSLTEQYNRNGEL